MATLPVSIADVKNILNLSSLKKSDLFELHQPGVLLYLKSRTTTENYAAAVSGDEDDDTARVTAFKLSYSFMMLHSTLEFLNLNTMGEGIVESTGIDTLQTRLLSTSSIEQKKNILERRALSLLKPYLNREGLERLTSLIAVPNKRFRATLI